MWKKNLFITAVCVKWIVEKMFLEMMLQKQEIINPQL